MWIYFIQDGDRIKIGHSINPKERINSLSLTVGRPLKILGIMPEVLPVSEYAVHQKFKDYCIQTEWFEAHPEIFSFIKTNTKPLDEYTHEISKLYSRHKRRKLREKANTKKIFDKYVSEKNLDEALKFKEEFYEWRKDRECEVESIIHHFKHIDRELHLWKMQDKIPYFLSRDLELSLRRILDSFLSVDWRKSKFILDSNEEDNISDMVEHAFERKFRPLQKILDEIEKPEGYSIGRGSIPCSPAN